MDMTDWDCLKGLGKTMDEIKGGKPPIVKKPKTGKKLTYAKKLERAEKRILKGKWVGRKIFLSESSAPSPSQLQELEI